MNISNPNNESDTRSKAYPDLPNVAAGWNWYDRYIRTALNTTGILAIYTETAAGAGSSSFSAGDLRLTTGGTIGNDIDVMLDGTQIENTSLTSDGNLSKARIDIYFKVTSAADIEAFLGMTFTSTAALSAMPTTARHIGIQMDISESANFRFTSGNNSAQALVDTGVAVDTDYHKISIIINDKDDFDLEFYDINGTTGAETLDASTTVTDVGVTVNKTNPATAIMHYFVQTEAAATKILAINGVGISWT